MCYPKPVELTLRVGPVHSNILDSGPGRTNPAKPDKFIKIFSISFGDDFHAAVRKISNPASHIKPPCQPGYLAPKEHLLHNAADQYSRTSIQNLDTK